MGRPLRGAHSVRPGILSVNPQIYIVTGASSGIGAAIAAGLVATGRQVLAVGRRAAVLDDLAARLGSSLRVHPVDLEDETAVNAFADETIDNYAALHGLIHCAGIIVPGDLGCVSTRHLDRMLAVNFRAPFLLTNRLIEPLVAARGHLLFVNSSAGLHASAGRSAYVASKFALRGLADAARLELNARGIRVASVYPGRTATPGMADLFAQEGRHYDAKALLQPEDVAAAVIGIIDAPDNAEITEISIRPRTKSY